jgi:hypothetical protein
VKAITTDGVEMEVKPFTALCSVGLTSITLTYEDYYPPNRPERYDADFADWLSEVVSLRLVPKELLQWT